MRCTGREHGFTLIELITVVVVLGIVGIGLFGFMGNSMLLFTGNVERDQLMTEGNFVMTRMQKEMQSAIPNSFRVAGNNSVHCVEYIPVVWPASYVTLPVNTASRLINLFFPYDPDGNFMAVSAGQYITVNPLQAADIYDSSRKRRVTVTACTDDGDGRCATRDDSDDVIQVTVNSDFAASSPNQYAYFLDRSVSYCVSNGRLYRKEGAIAVSQNLSLTGATLIAEHIVNPLSSNPAGAYSANNPFAVFAGMAGKSSSVRIHLLFNDGGEMANHHQEVSSAFRP